MESIQQLYTCRLVQRVVVVNRIYGPQRLTGTRARPYRELVFEQCIDAAGCPKSTHCPL
jgi:hypothetical protein